MPDIATLAINERISPDESMIGTGGLPHYFSVGASALANIRNAVEPVALLPGSILDFGCGAGRVTRWLAAAYPQARIEACDVRAEDVRFVSETFGAQTWISDPDIRKINPPATYDLVWVGSVFTHLPRLSSEALFDTLTACLNPGGVLVLTTHGRWPASRGLEKDFYGLEEEHWRVAVTDFHAAGYGFGPYFHSTHYGISLSKLSWWADQITSSPELRVIGMSEKSWDNHHDVVAVRKIGLSARI